MPHPDGEETFRQLRVIHPTVRVILMSGFTQSDVVNRFAGKGLAGFVQKPFNRGALAAAVRAALDSSAA
jgi:two-component system cell cycle sensor histidine kinase/response regulator CckA